MIDWRLKTPKLSKKMYAHLSMKLKNWTKNWKLKALWCRKKHKNFSRSLLITPSLPLTNSKHKLKQPSQRKTELLIFLFERSKYFTLFMSESITHEKSIPFVRSHEINLILTNWTKFLKFERHLQIVRQWLQHYLEDLLSSNNKYAEHQSQSFNCIHSTIHRLKQDYYLSGPWLRSMCKHTANCQRVGENVNQIPSNNKSNAYQFVESTGQCFTRSRATSDLWSLAHDNTIIQRVRAFCLLHYTCEVLDLILFIRIPLQQKQK